VTAEPSQRDLNRRAGWYSLGALAAVYVAWPAIRAASRMRPTADTWAFDVQLRCALPPDACAATVPTGAHGVGCGLAFQMEFEQTLSAYLSVSIYVYVYLYLSISIYISACLCIS
jgi:hypothetical protein